MLKPLIGTRIVATPAALDAVTWPEGQLVLRVAFDEAFVIGHVSADLIPDPHAIVAYDDSFAHCWMPAEQAAYLLERNAHWAVPQERPVFAQGAVADLPVKIWLEEERVLFVVPAAYGVDFEERMS